MGCISREAFCLGTAIPCLPHTYTHIHTQSLTHPLARSRSTHSLTHYGDDLKDLLKTKHHSLTLTLTHSLARIRIEWKSNGCDEKYFRVVPPPPAEDKKKEEEKKQEEEKEKEKDGKDGKDGTDAKDAKEGYVIPPVPLFSCARLSSPSNFSPCPFSSLWTHARTNIHLRSPSPPRQPPETPTQTPGVV